MYVISTYFTENLFRKLNVYSGSGSLLDLINPLLLFVMSIFLLDSRIVALRIFLVFIPLFYIFGADRLTMIYFFLIIYLAGMENKLNRTALIPSLLYFSVKTILFLATINSNGTGFI